MFLSATFADDGDCLVTLDGAGDGAVDIAAGIGGRRLVAAYAFPAPARYSSEVRFLVSLSFC